MTIIETILLSALPIFLMIGSVAGLIAGSVLILRPHWLTCVSLTANRWISTRHIAKNLETPIDVESCFYRHRRASGLVMLAGAMYVLYSFSLQIGKTNANSGYMAVLFDSMVLIMLLGAALALFVSLILLFRPNLLHKFEQGANESISLRRAMKPLEVLHNGVDEFTFRHSRKMGVILVLCSLYTLAAFTFWVK